MRYPLFLKEQETIGFVAPSFGCAIEPYYSGFRNALKKLRERGFQTETGPNCLVQQGIGISNSPQKCAAELMEYYESKKNNALISCGGGELMCTILPYMDFERIKAATPKWYMGYSDNTNFTFLLTTMCDVASIYGPCAASFGMEPYHQSIEDALSLLGGQSLEFQSYPEWEREKQKSEEQPLLPYNCTEPTVIHAYELHEMEKYREVRELSLQGRLIGGCMDCLQNLVGTPYDHVAEFAEKYKKDGILWFLESCDLNVFDIQRAMWQMEQAGWFAHCSGFLIGRPLCFGEEMMGLDQYRAVLSIAEKYKVPVLMDIDLGHCAPTMPFLTGAYGKAIFRNGKLQMQFHLI